MISPPLIEEYAVSGIDREIGIYSKEIHGIELPQQLTNVNNSTIHFSAEYLSSSIVNSFLAPGESEEESAGITHFSQHDYNQYVRRWSKFNTPMRVREKNMVYYELKQEYFKARPSSSGGPFGGILIRCL